MIASTVALYSIPPGGGDVLARSGSQHALLKTLRRHLQLLHAYLRTRTGSYDRFLDLGGSRIRSA